MVNNSTITGINTIKQDVNQNQRGNPDKNRAQSRKKGRRAGTTEPVDRRHTNTAVDIVSGRAKVASSQEAGDHEDIDTGVCFFWQKGSCAKGEACRFNHATPQVGSYYIINVSILTNDKVEDELVEGEKLMPEEENRAPSASSTLLLKAHSKQCYAWMKGTCTKGETCRFVHDTNVRVSRVAHNLTTDIQNRWPQPSQDSVASPKIAQS